MGTKHWKKHDRDSHIFRQEIENLLKKGAIVPAADNERGYIFTARFSFATFINIDGVPVGQHPVIIRSMKAIFNIKPALSKYNFTWHVGIAITYISKIDTNSLKRLSQKLATLLALLCGQRCGEILSVLDIRNLDLSENMCETFWRLLDPKTILAK